MPKLGFQPDSHAINPGDMYEAVATYKTIDLSSAKARGYVHDTWQKNKSESTKCNEIQYLRNQKNLPSNRCRTANKTTKGSVQGPESENDLLWIAKNLNAHAWALHINGILSAINYDDRTCYDFFPGTSPSTQENFSHLCTPMRKSVIGAAPNGMVSKFKNGKFYNFFKAAELDPIFIEQLPTYYSEKLYMYRIWLENAEFFYFSDCKKTRIALIPGFYLCTRYSIPPPL